MRYIRTILCRGALLLAFCVASEPVWAKNYFVAEHGDDRSAGTLNEPFKSLARVNSLRLKPGDKVLLHAGDQFPGTLIVRKRSGKSGKPILITTYGDGGERASIDAKGQLAGVQIVNSRHIRVENLEITADGGEPVVYGEGFGYAQPLRAGVIIALQGTSHNAGFKDIHLDNLRVHSVFHHDFGSVDRGRDVNTQNGRQAYGYGIRVFNQGNGRTVLSDVSISNSEIFNVSHTGIKVTGRIEKLADTPYDRFEQFIRNVVIANNRLSDIGGPGIQFSGVDGSHVHHNVTDGTGSHMNSERGVADARKWGRGSGMWTWASNDVLVENNQFLNASGPADSAGFHIDFHCSNVIAQYNLSANNEGGFIEILGNNRNNAYRFNVSVNDGARVKGQTDKPYGRATHNGKTLWFSGFVGMTAQRKVNPLIAPVNNYIYNNTVYTSHPAQIAINSQTSGILIANNIFYFSHPTASRYLNSEAYQLTRARRPTRTEMVNNLYLQETDWPSAAIIQDRSPVFGDPAFTNAGGPALQDYVPTNVELIAQRGMEITKLPADEYGLDRNSRVQGLLVTKDAAGNPIDGRPPLGALVPVGEANNSYRSTSVVNLTAGNSSQAVQFDHSDRLLDLSSYAFMALDVQNEGAAEITVDVEYFGPQRNHVNQGRCFVSAHESRTCLVILNRPYEPDDSAWTRHFGQVRGLPGKYVMHWNGFDLSQIRRTDVSVSWESSPSSGSVIINQPYGFQTINPGDYDFSKQPRPILDEFGQYAGADWPGKIVRSRELRTLGEKDRKKYVGAGFDDRFSRFGGWVDGPRQEATGFFYTRKLDGKWWFVDPDGYLFWSHGVVGVNRSTVTPLAGREEFFPDPDDLKSRANRDAFRDGGIDFKMANKVRRYGKDWRSVSNEVNIGRLKSWGVNTIGAWSEVDHKTRHPYTLIIHPSHQGMGKIRKMIDPFSDDYLSDLRTRLNRIRTHNENPWLLGVFINNELHWHDDFVIPNEVLSVGNDIPARQAMNAFLMGLYETIDELNASWASNFENFEDIKGRLGTDFNQNFEKDMRAFLKFYAEEYYRVTAEEFRKVFPNHLYFGSRIHGRAKNNRPVQEAASKYCDVVSFNIYEYSVSDFEPLLEDDKPAIIGEFHFGTASHGVWGTGLRAAFDLDNQGALYERYIRDAARHPHFVGAHWFIFQDQLATGRFDGENFRIGVLRVTDVPYQEMAEAMKDSATSMYQERSQ